MDNQNKKIPIISTSIEINKEKMTDRDTTEKFN